MKLLLFLNFFIIATLADVHSPECFIDSQCPDDKGCFNQLCLDFCSAQKCPENSKCVMKNHRPVCECQVGFIDDGFGDCDENSNIISGSIKNESCCSIKDPLKQIHSITFVTFNAEESIKIQEENFEIALTHKSDDVESFKLIIPKCVPWENFCYEENVKFLPVKVNQIFPNIATYVVNNAAVEKVQKKNFERLGSLEILDLSSNRINKIDLNAFDDLARLNFLVLKNNKINTISRRWFKNLIQINLIDLSSNPLSFPYLNVFKGSPVRQLSLFSIGLNNFNPKLFENAKNLNGLDIGGNELKNLDENAFEKLTNLNFIGLRYCRLTNISKNLFKSLKNLKQIDLSVNQLKSLHDDIFENQNSLEEVIFRESSLNKLPKSLLNSAETLKVLAVSDNKLKTLDSELFSRLNHLEVLDVTETSLTTLETKVFKNLPNLKKLVLNYNRIESLNPEIFENLLSLEELDATGLSLTELPANLFKNNKNLQKINFKSNYLKTLPTEIFQNMSKLTEIDLTSNSITNLDAQVFGGLSGLKELKMDNNKLTELPEEIFHDLSSLEKISINNNKLKTKLSSKLFENKPKLGFVGLRSSCVDETYGHWRGGEILTNNEKEILINDIDKKCQ